MATCQESNGRMDRMVKPSAASIKVRSSPVAAVSRALAWTPGS
ncbi:MAG TPA: hypothetical protein VKI19_09235 [Acidimicrobiales bacterium]|nr:hypothetical protein [Acidimicrobiales bacterium]